MGWARIVGALALVFVVAGVVAVVTLNTTDWSRYQGPVVQAVEDATGRKLAIEGQLRLRLGFSPAVTVAGVTLANAEWGSRPQMARFEHFAVRLRLWPLFFGQVEVERVELRDFEVLLETSTEGKGNWVFKPAAQTPEPEPPAGALGDAGESTASRRQEAAGSASTIAAVAAVISEVLIEDLELVYREGASGRVRQLRVERLRARRPKQTAPVTLELAAYYNGEPVELHATLEGVGDVMTGGALGVALALRAGGARIQAKGQVETPLEAKGIRLAISAQGETPASLSGLVGTAVPDLGSYMLSATVSGGDPEYRVRDLEFRLGRSDIKGQLAVQLGDRRPRLDVALRSARIDLADFRDKTPEPLQGGAAAKGAEAIGGSPDGDGAVAQWGDESQGRIFPDDALPVEGLNSADAELSLNISELVQNEITLRNLELRASLREGLLSLKPMRAELSGGRIGLDLTLDGSRREASIATQVRVRQVDVGELLAALNVTEVMSGGKLDLGIDVSGRGESVHRIMESLSGRLELEMGTGTIQDRWAELVLSDLGSLIARGGRADRAAVNCVVSRFDIDRGLARATRLAVDTTGLALFGEGYVDLGGEELDLRFDPLAKSRGAAVATPPATIRGSLSSPKFGVDTAALAGKAAGILFDLASEGSVKPGGVVVTQPGTAGCHQLLAMRAKRRAEAAASRAELERASKEAAEKAVDKGRERLDKAAKDLTEQAAKGLDKLFGR